MSEQKIADGLREALTHERLTRLIEDVYASVEGKRIATRTAHRIASEVISDGYTREAKSDG